MENSIKIFKNIFIHQFNIVLEYLFCFEPARTAVVLSYHVTGSLINSHRTRNILSIILSYFTCIVSDQTGVQKKLIVPQNIMEGWGTELKYFFVDVKSVHILCLLTSISGYRTGRFKKPVERSLWVFSDKNHNRKRLLDTMFTTKIYNERELPFLCYFTCISLI